MSDYPISIAHVYSNLVTSVITTAHCNINDKYLMLKLKEIICNLRRNTKFFVNTDCFMVQ